MPICRECLAILRPTRRLCLAQSLTTRPSWTVTQRSVSSKGYDERMRTARAPPASRRQDVKVLESLMMDARSTHTVSSRDLQAMHGRIVDLAASVLKPEDGQLPKEDRVLYVLEQYESLAKGLIEGHMADAADAAEQGQKTAGTPTTTATSALLGSVNLRSYPAFITKASLLNTISEKAEDLMRHRDVFITPAVLRSYVDLQALLHRPYSFPDIFALYARKPIPQRTADGTKYTAVSPDKINAAIDASTATRALDSAIAAHNLPLAIDILSTTFCTPAFKRAKILRQALVPIAGLAVAPFAAYTLSTQYSALQTSMDPGHATAVAFAGIMTYVAAVGTMGYVTVTTANDQMERVTWATGLPLWERWVREEERAALDRVAGAWGFQERERRGEEEGEEWEALKEFVGLRGMVLDRVELMDGME